MSLRGRMGLASGLAVAIAVLAVAVSSYAGMRSELRGQVDQSLQSLRRQVLPGPGGGGPSPGGGPPGPNQFGEPPGVRDEGLGIDQRTGPRSVARAGSSRSSTGTVGPTTPAASGARSRSTHR